MAEFDDESLDEHEIDALIGFEELLTTLDDEVKDFLEDNKEPEDESKGFYK